MSEPAPEGHLAPWTRRHAYTLVVTGMLSAFLGLFLLAEWLRVPLLSDASAGYLDNRSWMVAMFGLALLVLDVLLPVPASGVMTVGERTLLWAFLDTVKTPEATEGESLEAATEQAQTPTPRRDDLAALSRAMRGN